MNKFGIYRFIFPFRYRLQRRFRLERINHDMYDFERQLDIGYDHRQVARTLWDALRSVAFVADFRPSYDDDLAALYAMGPDEVRDELIDVILNALSIDVSGINFSHVDFGTIKSPKDVANFIVNVVGAGDSLHLSH